MNNSSLFLLNLSVLQALIITFGYLSLASATSSFSIKDEYSCTPCGQLCDKEVYSADGICSHCYMPLVKKATIDFKTIESSEICNYIS